MRDFDPPRWLRGGHRMTIYAWARRRSFPCLPAPTGRVFDIDAGTPACWRPVTGRTGPRRARRWSPCTASKEIEGQRQVAEQAVAVLINLTPDSFKLEPLDELRVAKFGIPSTLPSTLLERRPDVAMMERRMAEANRVIGIARAAFFPNVSFRLAGGFEEKGLDLIKIANTFWSYGATFSVPLFRSGYRRAQLQQAWSAYRETEDLYPSTVLRAFREVSNSLTLTNRLTVAAERQEAAVGANAKTQKLTMQLYRCPAFITLAASYFNCATTRVDALAWRLLAQAQPSISPTHSGVA